MQQQTREKVLRRLLGLSVILLFEVVLLLLLPRHGAEDTGEATRVISVPVNATVAGTASVVRPATTGVVAALGDEGHKPGVPDAGLRAAGTTVAQAAGSGVASDRAGVPAASTATGETAHPSPSTPPQAADSRGSAETKPVQGSYYVQVGSFSDGSNASRVRAKLERLGYAVRVHATVVDGRVWYRVQAGPYGSEATATGARRQLITQGYRNGRVLTPSTR